MQENKERSLLSYLIEKIKTEDSHASKSPKKPSLPFTIEDILNEDKGLLMNAITAVINARRSAQNPKAKEYTKPTNEFDQLLSVYVILYLIENAENIDETVYNLKDLLPLNKTGLTRVLDHYFDTNLDEYINLNLPDLKSKIDNQPITMSLSEYLQTLLAQLNKTLSDLNTNMRQH